MEHSAVVLEEITEFDSQSDGVFVDQLGNIYECTFERFESELIGIKDVSWYSSEEEARAKAYQTNDPIYQEKLAVNREIDEAEERLSLQKFYSCWN